MSLTRLTLMDVQRSCGRDAFLSQRSLVWLDGMCGQAVARCVIDDRCGLMERANTMKLHVWSCTQLQYIYVVMYTCCASWLVRVSLATLMYDKFGVKDSLRGSSVKLGTMLIILSWPLRKDDTHTHTQIEKCKHDTLDVKGKLALHPSGISRTAFYESLFDASINLWFKNRCVCVYSN